jgi:hypothetical protein
VTNSPPFFFGGKIPEYFIVPISTSQTYQLPPAVDREGQEIIILAREVKKNNLPGFVRFNSLTNEFRFSPSFLETKDKYQIELQI